MISQICFHISEHLTSVGQEYEVMWPSCISTRMEASAGGLHTVHITRLCFYVHLVQTRGNHLIISRQVILQHLYNILTRMSLCALGLSSHFHCLQFFGGSGFVGASWGFSLQEREIELRQWNPPELEGIERREILICVHHLVGHKQSWISKAFTTATTSTNKGEVKSTMLIILKVPFKIFKLNRNLDRKKTKLGQIDIDRWIDR